MKVDVRILDPRMFTPDDAASGGNAPGEPLLKGFYRAGSDHRKDGQAVGY